MMNTQDESKNTKLLKEQLNKIKTKNKTNNHNVDNDDNSTSNSNNSKKQSQTQHQNQPQNQPNTTSNNKSQPYNKKSLMHLSNSQHISSVFDSMNQKIDTAIANNPSNSNVNLKNYLNSDDNKKFHLEIIKRSFKGDHAPKFITPDDFAPVVADYFKLCYDFNKLPTITGLTSFANISISTFNKWKASPQSLLFDIANSVSNFIHDLTLNATIERFFESALIPVFVSKLVGNEIDGYSN